MMDLLSIFGMGTVWSLFGVVSLITTIWLAGPSLEIFGSRPLEPTWVRIALSAAILVIFFGVEIYKWYKNKKLNDHVIEELKASETTDTQEPRKRENQLQSQFNSIDHVLQRHHQEQSANYLKKFFSDKHEYIYQKPWFLVVGAPGVGKTSAILNSGLTFPVGTTDDVSRLTGTKDCDWFLSDEALILDTAGRFVDQSQAISDTDSEDWKELLDLLKRCRTKQPINGLLMMISVEDILTNNEAQLQQQLNQIRLRLQELQTSFKTTFPVYLVVNKIDLIPGFLQYFNLLNESDVKKTLGISLDALTPTSAEKINQLVQGLDKLTDEVKQSLFASIAYNNQHNDPSDMAISFASQFDDFSQQLKIYLKKLFNLSRYDSDIHLAGVYFTSAVQQTQANPVAPVDDNLALQSKYVPTNGSNLIVQNRPFFIHDIFHQLLLNTANLAGTDAIWLAKRRKIYWLGITALSIIGLTLLGMMIRAYLKNNHYLVAVTQHLRGLETDVKKVDGRNFSQIYSFSNRVRTLPDSNIDKRLLDTKLINNLGLNQYEDIKKATNAKYQNIINEKLTPSIASAIEDELNRSVQASAYGPTYQNLKAYLMLYQPNHYDANFISQWVVERIVAQNGLNSIKPEEADALKKIIAAQKIRAKTTYDEALVTQARNLLAGQDIAVTVYSGLLIHAQTLDSRSLPKISYVTMGGPSTQSIFRRNSNSTLNDPIPPVYTKFGYRNIFLPYVNQQLKQYYKEEKWVIGEQTYRQTPEQVIADIYQRYTNDYIQTWKSYLDDISMLQPKNLQQSIVMSKQLSEKNSSLAGIIRAVSDNTNLMLPASAQATTASTTNTSASTTTTNKTSASIVAATAVAQKAVKTDPVAPMVVIDETQVQGYLQNIASGFSQFQILTQTSAESGSQLDEIIKSINDMYIYLVALQMSIQNNDQLMPDNKPLINYQAQINRLPASFRPLLDQFVTQVNKTKAEYQQSKEEEAQKKAAALAEENRKQQEAAAEESKKQQEAMVVDTVKQQDQVVQMNCKSLTKDKYPFSLTATKDISLQEFGQVFGKDGIFLKTLGGSVSMGPNQGRLFTEFLDNKIIDRKDIYSNAERINMQYLAGANAPHIDIAMKIIAMDKKIDNLSINYNGKTMDYYHGPQKTFTIAWPAQDNQFVMKATSSIDKPSTLDVKGKWAIFKLMDKATKIIKTDDGKGVLATFNLDKKPVYIEFKSVSGTNPFNMALFKEFKC